MEENSHEKGESLLSTEDNQSLDIIKSNELVPNLVKKYSKTDDILKTRSTSEKDQSNLKKSKVTIIYNLNNLKRFTLVVNEKISYSQLYSKIVEGFTRRFEELKGLDDIELQNIYLKPGKFSLPFQLKEKTSFTIPDNSIIHCDLVSRNNWVKFFIDIVTNSYTFSIDLEILLDTSMELSIMKCLLIKVGLLYWLQTKKVDHNYIIYNVVYRTSRSKLNFEFSFEDKVNGCFMLEKLILSDILLVSSEIYCEIYLTSIEELVFRDFVSQKFEDEEKNERLSDIQIYSYTEFENQRYFKSEKEAIINLVREFIKSVYSKVILKNEALLLTFTNPCLLAELSKEELKTKQDNDTQPKMKKVEHDHYSSSNLSGCTYIVNDADNSSSSSEKYQLKNIIVTKYLSTYKRDVSEEKNRPEDFNLDKAGEEVENVRKTVVTVLLPNGNNRIKSLRNGSESESESVLFEKKLNIDDDYSELAVPERELETPKRTGYSLCDDLTRIYTKEMIFSLIKEENKSIFLNFQHFSNESLIEKIRNVTTKINQISEYSSKHRESSIFLKNKKERKCKQLAIILVIALLLVGFWIFMLFIL